MSHTTTIKAVPVTDISALQAAVAELKAKGVNIELIQDAVPRMYYANQHGKCDYVVQLNNSRYDVGFEKQADGSYTPVLDTWAGEINRSIGASCPLGEYADQGLHAIGQLMQSYSKHAAINAAVSEGHTVSDCYVDTDGNVQLTLQVA